MITAFRELDNLEDVKYYYQYRGRQLLCTDWEWIPEVEPLQGWGARTVIRHLPTDQLYESAYVFAGHRGQGHYTRYAKSDRIHPIWTMPDCHLRGLLESLEVPYRVIRLTEYDTVGYGLVEQHYGDRRAARSGELYINHILEGLAILRGSGLYSTELEQRVMEAYALHPLFQADNELVNLYMQRGTDEYPAPVRKALNSLDYQVMILVLEYRQFANAYLATRDINSITDIAMPPIKEVRAMLAMDKIQNYKDFLRHHSLTHPNRDRLDQYFRNWLERLEIPMDYFNDVCGRISAADCVI